MAVDYSRIHRLLEIVVLIQGSKRWTAKSLAKELGKDVRTIYRDMKALEGAGIPYFYDEVDKCYQIRKDFFLPPVQLTLDEALALTVLAEQVGKTEQVPLLKPAAKAIHKIRGQLPATIRAELEKVQDHVAVKLAASSAPEAIESVYETVRDAVSKKRALLCKYESASNPSPESVKPFLFHPYTLLFNQRAWYAVGLHARHKEVRSLRLSRFVSLKPTDETYTVPKSFKLDAHLGKAWRMIRSEPREAKVELLFDPEFADTISDTHWHATQEVTWNDDGSITFTCTVDGFDEIVWWIMSMGPHCVVRKPTALAERVTTLAREMVARYEKLS